VSDAHTAPGSAGAPRIERVEVAPAEDGLFVRVSGQWDEPPAQMPALLLLVPDLTGGAVQAFAALEQTSRAAARAAGPNALRATFAVPASVRGALAGTLTLRLGERDVSLPPATEVEPAGEGGVLDRAVVAERRARRAELAEQESSRRALEAERGLAALEGELARLELRLGRARVERDDATLALEQPAAREGALADALRPRQEAPAAQRLREMAARERPVTRPGEREALERRAAELVETLRADLAALRDEMTPAVDEEAVAAVQAATVALTEADRQLAAARLAAQEQAGLLEAEREARARVERELGEQRIVSARWQALALRLLALTRALKPVVEAVEAPGETRPSAPSPDRDAWLPRGLAALATSAPASAVGLGLALIAGQGLDAERSMRYELHVPPLGRYRVEIENGHARVQPAASVARGVALIETDAAGFTRLLTDGGSKGLLGETLRVHGVLRRGRVLKRIPAAELRLDRLAEAGIWPDPVLVYRALAALIDPAHTAGERFTVDYEVRGPRGARFHVVVADGDAVAVLDGPSTDPAVRVGTTHRLFQHLLGTGTAPEGERLEVRGDAAALARLHRWVAAARDGG
jgi:hypothetical protein